MIKKIILVFVIISTIIISNLKAVTIYTLQTITGENGGDAFGYSCDSGGDLNNDGYDDLIVGAHQFNGNQGKTYIYFGGSGMTFDSTPDVEMTGAAGNNYFGRSVTIASNINNDSYADVIVGAYGADKVYIYYGGDPMNNIADITLSSPSGVESFGWQVGSGDVNNDGYNDILIGAYTFNASQGHAYVYYGGPSMDNIADVTMTGGVAGDNFGYSIDFAGDVNNEGYGDVIVGAPGVGADKGRAYIFFGGGPMNNVADVTMDGVNDGDRLGNNAVSGVGDINGDGYDDVVVDNIAYNGWDGICYLYYGGNPMDNGIDISFPVNDDSGGGYGIDGGDINGNGTNDIIIGYPWAPTGFLSKGRIEVFYDSPMDNTFEIFMEGAANMDEFGTSVACEGDLNGDGFNEIIVGAFGYNAGAYQGRCYIYTVTNVSPPAIGTITPSPAQVTNNDSQLLSFTTTITAKSGGVGDVYMDLSSISNSATQTLYNTSGNTYKASNIKIPITVATTTYTLILYAFNSIKSVYATNTAVITVLPNNNIPAIGNITPSPTLVTNNDSQLLSFTATITDKDGGIGAVYMNLGPIGNLATQTLYNTVGDTYKVSNITVPAIVPAANYILTLYAYNNINTAFISDVTSMTVISASLPPAIVDITPSPTQVTNNDLQQLSITATITNEGGGIGDVFIDLSPISSGTQTLVDIGGDTYQVTGITIPASVYPTNYTLILYAYNNINTEFVSNVTSVTVIYTPTPPAITNLSSSVTQVLNNSSQLLSFTVTITSNDGGIGSVYMNLASIGNSSTQTLYKVSGNTWKVGNITIPVNVKGGNYTLTLYAGNNPNTAFTTDTISITVISIIPPVYTVCPTIFKPEGGLTARISFGRETPDVDIIIYDTAGNIVKTFPGVSGVRYVLWEGMNDSGDELNTGMYIVYIKSKDGEEQKIKMVIIRKLR